MQRDLSTLLPHVTALLALMLTHCSGRDAPRPDAFDVFLMDAPDRPLDDHLSARPETSDGRFFEALADSDDSGNRGLWDVPGDGDDSGDRGLWDVPGDSDDSGNRGLLDLPGDSESGDTGTPDPTETWELPYVEILSPQSGTRTVAGSTVHFQVRTNCSPGIAEFLADDQYVFGSVPVSANDFSYDYSFNTPGIDRKIRVTVLGKDDCQASHAIHLTVQPVFQMGIDLRTDSNGNPFTVRWVHLPTAADTHSILVAGSTTARTVQQHALANSPALAAVNAGYFAFGQGPVSYAKGREGYESPSGNVKGPRGCFWFDEVTGNSGVELSWGREKLSSGWGEGLFLHATDVLCAGPVLVRDGSNVVTQQFEVENFQTSGISPDSALPRTALCRMADSSILVLTAQNETVKARGFTLGALADYLVARGCQDALNLDGGGSVAFWSSVDPAGYWPGTEDRPVYQTVVVR